MRQHHAEELFLEDFLLQLPELGGWRSNRQIRSSPFSQKPLAVPLDWEGVAAVLGESALVEEVVRVHNEMADVIDLELVLRVVKMIHQGGSCFLLCSVFIECQEGFTSLRTVGPL